MLALLALDDVFSDGMECFRSDLDDKFQEVEFVVGIAESCHSSDKATTRHYHNENLTFKNMK